MTRSRGGWSGSRLIVASCLTASLLGVLYGLYRGYYALGGTAGMFGELDSRSQWLALNGFAALAVLLASAVPPAALPLSRSPGGRTAMLVLFSVAAVGLAVHGLVDEVQRALSVSGLADRWHLELAARSTAGWAWRDQRVADLQDMLLNEPWFLAEGVLCGAVVWLALATRRARRHWLTGAAAGVVLLTAYGVLAATGVIGRAVVF